MRTPKLFTERAVNATLDLQTGLDLTESDTGMEVCRNLVWENGRLQTRAGLLCGEWAQSPRVGEYIYWKMRFTDVISEQNGRKVRLAYDAVSDDISSLRIRTFWADESNHLTACGEILFLRTTSEIFYLPESVCFFSAGRIGGSGIYAFIRSCSGDEPEWFTVYELDTEENEWESVSPDYYYIPTIYINGRGDQYDFSYDAGGAYHPAPRSPESQNLLSGEFRAFFSSDGYSSRFQLPVTNLDNSSVFCRVYWDSSSYTEWVVPQNSSSVAVAYYTTTITLHCNRTTGELWFTTQAGEPFPVPKMTAYDGNNIHITASHTISDGAAQICGAKCMLASGEHLYLAGSSCHPGRICIARRSNPFYFPQDAVIEAGDDRHPILKMATLGGEVLAFKENEIYRITSSGSRYKIADQTLVEGESLYHPRDPLHIRQIHSSIGCELPETLAQAGDRLVWLNRNGTVYGISSAGSRGDRNLERLSDAIAPSLLSVDYDECCAGGDEKGYLLFSGHSAWHWDGKRWFQWSFPSAVQVLSAGMLAGKLRLLCRSDDSPKYCCMADFGGTEDRIYPVSSSDGPESFPIEYALGSKPVDFGRPETRKSFDWLDLTGCFTEDFSVECGRMYRCDGDALQAETKTYSLRMAEHGVMSAHVGICGRGKAAITRCRIRYRISEVG